MGTGEKISGAIVSRSARYGGAVLRRAARALDRAAVLSLRGAAKLDAVRKRAPAPAILSAEELRASNERFMHDLLAGAPPAGGPSYTAEVVRFFADITGSPMYQTYVTYALSSLARGERFVEAHRSELAGAQRFLDVGCAYGGVVLAVARASQASCTGLEYSGRLLSLARAQAAELGLTGRVSFFEGDILAAETVSKIGRYDLMSCIDVLEHVLDPALAIESLSACLEPGGRIFVDVPNPDSFDSITKDPHHHLFGSVLLSRDDAIRVFEHELKVTGYDVGYYHSLEWYEERLRAAGLDVEVLDTPPTDDRALAKTAAGLAKLGDDFIRARSLRDWPDWRVEAVGAALAAHERMASADRAWAASSPRKYQLRYAVPVLHFRCTKRA